MNTIARSTSARDMENWFRDVGRTILLETLGDTCDRVNSRFNTDYQSYAQERLDLAAELETLRPIASHARRLEDENATLKNEIKTLKDASREQTHAPSNASHTMTQSALRTPLAPKSANQTSSKWANPIDVETLTLSELKAEFLRAEKKHAKLHDKFLDLQAALHKSNELLRERTATYRQWVDHAKQLNEQSLKRSRRIKKLEAKLAEISQESLSLSFSSDTGDVEVATEPAILAPIYSHQPKQLNEPKEALVATPNRKLRTLPCTEDNRTTRSPSLSYNMFNSDHSSSRSELISLQRTNEPPPCLPPLPPLPPSYELTDRELCIKHEPSSDTPVVVSERYVRKRKNADDDEGGISTPSRVKIEHSPKPQSSSGRRHFAPHESIDFDTEYRIVETPRKHARYQYVHNARLDDESGNQGPAHGTIITHSTENLEYNNPTPTTNASSTDLTAANRAELQINISAVLQPLSNNQVLKPRLNPVSITRNRESSIKARSIANLAEDNYQNEILNLSNNQNVPKASALEQLLNTPSPAHDNMAARSICPAEDGQPSNVYFQLPKRRELPFETDARKSLDSTSKENTYNFNQQADLPSVDQDHDKATTISRTEMEKTGVPTLRQLPKAKLCLDDFKINPHANEGYDYAFTDVVRRKDDRACLQGCVKENCCGHKFRALAHAYRAGTRPCDFQALLELHLGDDCHRLSTMSEAEKETLWVEAKIRELANASSKHRYRYPRMSTPPGFWRADFPSTQEGEEYSEEAAKLERETIDERHREAMRPGGLWVFRDE